MANKSVSDEVYEPAGVAEGTEFPNEHGTEVVVYDRDDEGNVIGWHKELK